MQLRYTRFFALAILLAVVVAVRADDVDDYIKAELETQHLPGLSLVVIKDMKIVKVEGYGLANIELNVAARPDTVYKIGSVSKQFIATGIMLLVQDGKINLTDPIGKFLDGSPDTWKDITIRHLLTHTSGIVREAPGFDPLKIQSDADVIKTAYSLPLRFAPGEKYEYCNVGYFTLAEIIRKVSGKPWGEFLNERIFASLEMTATRTTSVSDLVSKRADGYVWRNGKFQNATEYLALRPSGAFLSTVIDLAKWDAALNSGKILKQAELDLMWTPTTLNNGKTSPYGFGWQLNTVKGDRKHVYHGGSLPGFRAQLGRFLDDKLTVVVLTNGDNADAESIALGVANHYVPGLIRKRVLTKIDPKILDTYVGLYQAGSSVLTVTREGDKLMTQEANSEKRELLPENATDFFMTQSPRQTFSFIKDETGQVHLVLKVEDREVARAKKIK